MIAPYREPGESGGAAAKQSLYRARQAVASTFLRPVEEGERPAPPVPAWQAWLIALWMVSTAVVYAVLFFRGWK
jgi:hypothetical protein